MTETKPTIGPAYLTVADMARSLDFYQRVMGFTVHQHEGQTAQVGSEEHIILHLREIPGAAHAPTHATGLFHFAVLVPTRLDLARWLRQLIQVGYALDGASDHLVSEALYLTDPDGHGIEVYRDRPRDEWPRTETGAIKMATNHLDLNSLLNELNADSLRWKGIAPGSLMGHIHLKVGNIKAAEGFYSGTLGIPVMTRYGGQASFLGLDGYHHHIGINVWQSRGGSRPPANSAHLDAFVLRLPDAAARIAPLHSEDHPAGTLVRDPFGIGVVVA